MLAIVILLYQHSVICADQDCFTFPYKGGSEDDQAYYRGHTSAQPKVFRVENMENPRKVAAITSEEGVPSSS